jgi:hypothetical protein
VPDRRIAVGVAADAVAVDQQLGECAVEPAAPGVAVDEDPGDRVREQPPHEHPGGGTLACRAITATGDVPGEFGGNRPVSMEFGGFVVAGQ